MLFLAPGRGGWALLPADLGRAKTPPSLSPPFPSTCPGAPAFGEACVSHGTPSQEAYIGPGPSRHSSRASPSPAQHPTHEVGEPSLSPQASRAGMFLAEGKAPCCKGHRGLGEGASAAGPGRRP